MKPLYIVLVFIFLAGCSEAPAPALTFVGKWNAAYTFHSDSFVDEYKTYSWKAELVLNADGTGKAYHEKGNPIIPEEAVEENLSWRREGEHAVYILSKNWSVTNENMLFEIREFSPTYVKMQGFDDHRQLWQLTINKK